MCDNVVCERVICVTVLCVKGLPVTKVCVKMLCVCVDFLCDNVVCERIICDNVVYERVVCYNVMCGSDRGGGGGGRVQSGKTGTPHKRCGEQIAMLVTSTIVARCTMVMGCAKVPGTCYYNPSNMFKQSCVTSHYKLPQP